MKDGVLTQLKKFFGILLSFLPHLNIALSVVMISLFILDRFNRAMVFLTNDLTKWMLAVFCVLVLIQSVAYIVTARKNK